MWFLAETRMVPFRMFLDADSVPSLPPSLHPCLSFSPSPSFPPSLHLSLPLHPPQMAKVRTKRLEAAVKELESELERSQTYAKEQEKRISDLTERLSAASAFPTGHQAIVTRCLELEGQLAEMKKQANGR